MTTYPRMPTRSGIQPPRSIFSELAARKATSTAPSTRAVVMAAGLGQPQFSRITVYTRMVVISIVAETATP
jgi:hypothetical protein